MTERGEVMESTIVRTTRMSLRPLRRQDRDEFLRVHEISRELYAPWSPSLPADEILGDLFELHLAKAQEGARDGTEFRLVGILDDGRIGGFFNLFHIARGAFQSGVASWAVNAEVAGQGIATEGVTGLLDWAFAPPPLGLGLHRVQANVIPGNIASVRVAEKNGFRREGLGVRYLKIAGRWQDHIFFARLADEHEPVYLRYPAAK